MTAVGEVALWVALFLSIWGSAVSFAGSALRRPELVESGARAVSATAAMAILASVGLWGALLSHDFSLRYVASHTTLNTPTLYLVTALWAGTAGALLSWAVALAACAAAAVSAARHRGDELPRIAGTLAAALALALAVICFATNPYDHIAWVPPEGQGLGAHLQTPLAIPHFVAVYVAYAAATVALVLAIDRMTRRRADAPSVAPLVRPWALTAWCLLAIAIALRLRWKYVQPALGGLWSWDPAEVANAVLWVAGTALVASLARGSADPVIGGARRPRVVGLYVVYFGVAVLLIGALGSRWWIERTIRVGPGQSAELPDPYGDRWRFVSQGASRDERVNYLSTGVALEAWRSGASAGIISAERRQYLDSAQRPIGDPVAEPGIRPSFAQDLYVLLAGVGGETAELRVAFRPIASCVWIGCALIVLGALATAVRSALGSRARGRPADATAG